MQALGRLFSGPMCPGSSLKTTSRRKVFHEHNFIKIISNFFAKNKSNWIFKFCKQIYEYSSFLADTNSEGVFDFKGYNTR